MKTKVRKSLSVMLSLCMVLAMFPMSALAAGSTAPSSAVLSDANATLTVTLAAAPVAGDTIKVYAAETGDTALQTLNIANTEVTQTITLNPAATGNVYVTYTGGANTESTRLASTGYDATHAERFRWSR